MNLKLKEKYHDIEWKVIEKEKYQDDIFGENINAFVAWELASKEINKKEFETKVNIN